MTKFIVTNTGYHNHIEKYAKAIENKIGIKINYDKDGEYYYYIINDLSIILEIVNILDDIGLENGIIITRAYLTNEYVIEIYDDWRE